MLRVTFYGTFGKGLTVQVIRDSEQSYVRPFLLEVDMAKDPRYYSEQECEYCGEIFLGHDKPRNMFQGHFCSRKCYCLFKRENDPEFWEEYKTIWVDGKRVLEHRYVMEQKLGRKLKPGEEVHHIDGNKMNNDPENLESYKSCSDHQIKASQDHLKKQDRKKKK